MSRNFPLSFLRSPSTDPRLLNPLAWTLLPPLDLIKVGVDGCSAKHSALDVNHRGSLVCNANPNKASGERLIEIIMRSGRSGIEHKQLLAINLVFATKK